MPKSKQTNLAVELISILIAIAALGAVSYLIYSIISPAQPLPIVLATGSIKTSGFTTFPTLVTFSSSKGVSYTTLANGHYAISLFGNSTYNATVYWKSWTGLVSGTCRVGTISIPANPGIVNLNFSC